MSLIKDFRYSYHALQAARSRTVLTMLGVIIGVMSVVAVSSVGESAQNLILDQVEAVGTNIVGVVSGGSDQENGPPPIAFGIITTALKNSDYVALRALPHVVFGNAITVAMESVTMSDNSMIMAITGGSEEQPEMESAQVESGRYFNHEEVASFARVVVLGSEAAAKLSPHDSPIGQEVRIKGYGFRVVGVMKSRGSGSFGNVDELIYAPYTSTQKFISGVSYLTGMRFRVDKASNLVWVKTEIARTLRVRHHITDPKKDDFTVRSSDQAIGIITGVTNAINAFLVLVTGISLLVGGINIMNIMYVAVRERTREIGLRKALGARPNRIRRQFLIESSLIAFSGGLIGLVIGALIAFAVDLVAKGYGLSWNFTLSIGAIAISLSVSIGVGLIFGVAPAAAAAKLDAIEALRYE